MSFDPGSFQMIEEMGVGQFLSVTQDLGIDVFLPNKEQGAVLTGASAAEDIARELDVLYPSALIVLKLDADGARRRIESRETAAGSSAAGAVRGGDAPRASLSAAPC